MELIKQQYKYDCGVACIAMFCGTAYHEAYNAIHEKYVDLDFNQQGISTDDLIVVCRQLGKNLVQVMDNGCFDAIYMVPSLNNPGALHFVCKRVHRGPAMPFKILDPSNEKTYEHLPCYNVYRIFADYGDTNVLIKATRTINQYKEAQKREDIKNGKN